MHNVDELVSFESGVILFFFFFQAEDGIRDDLVTGVQTCALPISDEEIQFFDENGYVICRNVLHQDELEHFQSESARLIAEIRSEERRVGKECRSRWVTYAEKKKYIKKDGVGACMMYM